VKTIDKPVLRKHHLDHIPDLRVDESIFTAKFASGCSMANCDAACCTYGVYADIQEREAILAHADTIRQAMDPHQVKDPALWFEERELTDHDFPSRIAIGTRQMEYGCVFLDGGGKCTLQKIAASKTQPYGLKPFYCIAYPVTIMHVELMLDEPDFASRPTCCGASRGGTLDIFDVCGDELTHVLGDKGVAELRRMMETL